MIYTHYLPFHRTHLLGFLNRLEFFSNTHPINHQFAFALHLSFLYYHQYYHPFISVYNYRLLNLYFFSDCLKVHANLNLKSLEHSFDCHLCTYHELHHLKSYSFDSIVCASNDQYYRLFLGALEPVPLKIELSCWATSTIFARFKINL